MASDLITSWEIDGETVETMRDYFGRAPKSLQITNCSHEIKRRLLLGRQVMINLDSLLKSRDITFANKGPSSQSHGFFSCHVWM